MKIIILLCLLTAVLGYDDTIFEDDFRAIDINADGILTQHEMDNKFEMFDRNGDSMISFVEFHKGLRPGMSLAVTQFLFNLYDKMDGHMGMFLDHSDVKMFFSLLDVDNNKNVTLAEYKSTTKLLTETASYEAGFRY